MAYTLDELDEALAESLGPRVWAAWKDTYLSRPQILERAASSRFWRQIPEDRNSEVMREAWRDLSDTGCLHPSGGWGPD